ncbi:MAG: DUF3592 domain-containing protein [Caulobacteraceae bacterium]
MFNLFRWGLIPVVLFCGVCVAAGIDAFSENAVRRATWPKVEATVLESQDFADELARMRGTSNNFPDPRGVLQYQVNGETHTWTGRGRDAGLIAMPVGGKVMVHYDPKNPDQVSTLEMLGAGTGLIILGAALAFLGFYFWFFWIRFWIGRSGPDDDDSGYLLGEAAPQAAPVWNAPAPGFGQGRPNTFGQR